MALWGSSHGPLKTGSERMHESGLSSKNILECLGCEIMYPAMYSKAAAIKSASKTKQTFDAFQEPR